MFKNYKQVLDLLGFDQINPETYRLSSDVTMLLRPIENSVLLQLFRNGEYVHLQKFGGYNFIIIEHPEQLYQILKILNKDIQYRT